jgi:predicted aspartyl protease
MQTGNGVTTGRLGQLVSVKVGDDQARRVDVIFVPDADLGGRMLLGMSFLGRFRVTMDAAGGGFRLEPPSD